MNNYAALIARLAEIDHIRSSSSVLGWDQQCYMPPGGAAERAEQLAVLRKISHQMHVDDATRKLLEGAEAECAGLDPHSDERLTLRVVRRKFDKASKLPIELVSALARETSLAHSLWVKARAANDWAMFAPTVERLVELARQQAEAYGYPERPYDALLDKYEPGMLTREVEVVFDALRPGLVELVQAVGAAEPVDDSPLRRDFEPAKQKAFGEFIIAKMGYDFKRGRQDEAVHPFCSNFGRDDVRITTRFDRNWLPSALMGTIHETGHAMYEQGLDPKDDNTPLSESASLGVHESQSRLWENIVGRSLGFWQVYYGKLKEFFPGVLDDVSVEQFYRALNQVKPSLIRVEADEVTYCLHIMLRFELEKALIDGSLAVKDVPAAWNAKMQDYLGVTPPNDTLGCLQDVHWSGASFGYFPTYALGTILSAQLFDKARADKPAIDGELAGGEFGGLLSWLREKVHMQGARWLPTELTQRVCGEAPQSNSYLNYLNTKFRGVYGLGAAAGA